MAWYDKLVPAFWKLTDNRLELINEDVMGGMPIGEPGQRSSIPDLNGSFFAGQTRTEITPETPREFLALLEKLARTNEDVGYALDNIVQLANTPHDIEFADDVPDEVQREVRLKISKAEPGWYQNSSGTRSLKADLLTQTVINGALSAEAVPNERLDDIKQVYRLAPKHVVQVYNRETELYEIFQRTGVTHGNNLEDSFNGLIKLNDFKYKYIAWRRFTDSPYGSPPFFSAIRSLLTRDNMIKNFESIMDKLGMLGFLNVTVTPPEKKSAETDKQYMDRSKQYLQTYVVPQIQKTLGQGFVAGFKGAHEFEMAGNKMNTQGAGDLLKIIDLIVFSGLKQDPNMLGRQFSVTETFGRVILTKLTSQVTDYQQIVDAFYCHLYRMYVMLQGMDPSIIKNVKSRQPLIQDQKKVADARKVEIENADSLYNQGVISQQERANMLGFDQPDQMEPRTQQSNGNGGDGGSDPEGRTDPGNEPNDGDASEAEESNANEIIDDMELRFKKHVPEYRYEVPEGCGGITKESFITFQEFDDEDLTKFNKDYFTESFRNYTKGMDKITKKVIARLKQLPETVTQAQAESEVYATILLNWDNAYANKQELISEKHIEKGYKFFRQSKKPFGINESDGFKKSSFADDDIPDAVFELADFRAIEYLKQSDDLFLSKFVTDEDTKRRILNFIGQNYIEGDLPFGETGDFAEFAKSLDKFMVNEGWKMRRIIDTTVNKIRNFANVNYMGQAKIERYEIVEIVDTLTCPWCAHMDGHKFSITSAQSKISKEVDAGPGNIAETNPFATSVPLQEFQKLDTGALESAGHVIPTFHPHCRGRVVADV